MTLNDLFKEHNLTAAERKEVVLYLAFLRMKKTLEMFGVLALIQEEE